MSTTSDSSFGTGTDDVEVWSVKGGSLSVVVGLQRLARIFHLVRHYSSQRETGSNVRRTDHQKTRR
jgi:hypothetical protein